jgi:hypothetical protein
MTIFEDARGATRGVDTYLDVHVAAALDPVVALLRTAPFPIATRGYQSGQLALVISLLITAKLVDWRNRWIWSWSSSLSAQAPSLDMLPRERTDVRRHPVVDDEQAKSSDGVGVALDLLDRSVGCSERPLKTANEQR